MLLQTHLNQPPLGNRGHPRDDRDRTGFFSLLPFYFRWLVGFLSLSLSLSLFPFLLSVFTARRSCHADRWFAARPTGFLFSVSVLRRAFPWTPEKKKTKEKPKKKAKRNGRAAVCTWPQADRDAHWLFVTSFKSRTGQLSAHPRVSFWACGSIRGKGRHLAGSQRRHFIIESQSEDERCPRNWLFVTSFKSRTVQSLSRAAHPRVSFWARGSIRGKDRHLAGSQ